MSDKKPNPYDIGPIFEAMTIDLINSLKRNLSRHKKEEIKKGFRWEQWQRSKLRNIAAYRRRNKSILNRATRQANKVVSKILNNSFIDGENRAEKSIVRILKTDAKIQLPNDFQPKKRGISHKKSPKAPKESAFFSINERKLEALQRTVTNDLNKVQNGVLRHMDDVYRQVIYKAEVNMTAGTKTLDQAIDMATKDFLQKGINTIEYADGRRVNIASYAEMALRTASQRATFLGEGKKRDEWGVYTVLMSAHANCSPMCLPYQGTVLIDDVYTSLSKQNAEKLSKETGYVLLSEAMKNHAFHPNCRHTLSTFFPGINTIPIPVDDKKALENYRAEQKQRYYERGIRMYKRLYEGSFDEVNQIRYKKKLNQWTNNLNKLLKENPNLRRDRKREVG